jgi:16S rRNA (guanine527-N7)-methyltransferase
MQARENVLDYLWQYYAMSKAIEAKLDHYVELLLQWQKKHNLISAHSVDDIWSRHILDSVSVLSVCPKADNALDLGSGGGLPAIVLAFFWQEQNPNSVSYMVESIAKKTSFLRLVSRETQINTIVMQNRIEAIDVQELPVFDIITSRALAPLDRLMDYSAPFFTEYTRAIFHKGRNYHAEITECEALKNFTHKVHYPAEISEGVLLEITRAGIV